MVEKHPSRGDGWTVNIEAKVVAKTMAEIDAMFPDKTSREAARAQVVRWIELASQFPHRALNWPPRRTADPQVFRFPADAASP